MFGQIYSATELFALSVSVVRQSHSKNWYVHTKKTYSNSRSRWFGSAGPIHDINRRKASTNSKHTNWRGPENLWRWSISVQCSHAARSLLGRRHPDWTDW